MSKNISQITRTLTTIAGTEYFAGRDGSGDFKIIADDLVSELIASNTAAIATNAENIATNTAAIAINVTNIANNTPVGIIQAYVGSTSPDGWLICQGATLGNAASGAFYAGADYEDLFDIIKGGWGNAGTEVFADDDTVVLPDLRGAFLRGSGDHGSGTMADGNPFSGPSVGSSENDQVQGHIHTFDLKYNNPGAGFAGKVPLHSSTEVGTYNVSSFSWTTESDGTNGTPRTGDETRPFNFGVNYIIKF